MTIEKFCQMPEWYAVLGEYAFPTRFVPVDPDLAKLIGTGDMEAILQNTLSYSMIAELKKVLEKVPGNCFACVDTCAPTDTERYAGKRGATYSAQSTFANLASSEKVREAARNGLVKNFCIRPFRRMTWPREFRLFIVDGELHAMSQYHLVRHYRRLEGVRTKYWQMAEKFVKKIADRLPDGKIVMDIYITSGNEILIIDFNLWGAPTDPLMLKTWDQDWNRTFGILLMAPPVQLNGDVNVSF